MLRWIYCYVETPAGGVTEKDYGNGNCVHSAKLWRQDVPRTQVDVINIHERETMSSNDDSGGS